MKTKTIMNIPPLDKRTGLWNAIVETPRGGRHKFKFDPEKEIFSLHRTLPEGMVFPFDFGFLPQTQGEDGDPLDALVLHIDGAFCGCLVPARLIGVIEATQAEKRGKKKRNDRLLLIPNSCTEMNDIKTAKDLPKSLLEGVEEFFITYNRLDGKQFKILKVSGPKAAAKLIERGGKAFRKNSE